MRFPPNKFRKSSNLQVFAVTSLRTCKSLHLQIFAFASLRNSRRVIGVWNLLIRWSIAGSSLRNLVKFAAIRGALHFVRSLTGAPLAPFSVGSLEFDRLAQSLQKSHDRHAPEECDNDGRRDAEGLHGIVEGLGERYHDRPYLLRCHNLIAVIQVNAYLEPMSSTDQSGGRRPAKVSSRNERATVKKLPQILIASLSRRW